jgi:hypothetical protein
MHRVKAMWEPRSRRWLIKRRRIGPVIRALRQATDPLFRQAGLDLDEGYGPAPATSLGALVRARVCAVDGFERPHAVLLPKPSPNPLIPS